MPVCCDASSLSSLPSLTLLQPLQPSLPAGVACDAGTLSLMGDQLRGRKASLEKSIREAAGPTGASVNLNSPKQIAELLYETLRIPLPASSLYAGQQHNKASTKGGRTHAPTDENTLMQLSAAYPVCGMIVSWRKLEKAENTFVTGLLNEVAKPLAGQCSGGSGRGVGGGSTSAPPKRPATLMSAWGLPSRASSGGGGGEGEVDVGPPLISTLPEGFGPPDPTLARAHAQTHVTNVGTGRLSSSDPNMQQLPADDPAAPGSDSPYAGILSQ